MNQDNDNEFWSKLEETLKPRLTEAQWTAQRARILSRLAPEGAGRLRPWVAAAAAACLAGLWFLLPVDKLLPRDKGETKVAEPAQVLPVRVPRPESSAWDARVTRVQGEVTVFANGSVEGVPAVEGMPLDEGDHVRTGTDGRAELALSAESVLDLGPGSAITLTDLKPRQTLLNLDLGTLVAKLRWQKTQGRRLDVMTPTVVAAVRGTEFGVTVQEGGDTSVGVFDEGRVAVRTQDAPAIEETMLEPRQEIHVPKGREVETETREGRSYLRVSGLSRLKPQQERIERVRERSDVLSRDWREMERPERELVRGRMIQEHRGRMQALPSEEQRSMREQLRRPERGERGGGGEGRGSGDGARRPQGGPSGGQAPGRQAGTGEGTPGRQESQRGPGAGGPRPDSRREDRGQHEGRQPGDGNQRRGPGDRSHEGADREEPGQPRPDEDRRGPGEGRMRREPGGPEDDGGLQPGDRAPGNDVEPGQRPQEGEGRQRGHGRGRPEQGGAEDGGGVQPGSRSPGAKDKVGPGEGGRRGPGGGRQRQGAGSREGGRMRSPGGQNRPQGGQNRRPAGPGRGRRN